MRLITSLRYAAESNESEYVATPLTQVMVLPHVEGFAVHRYEFFIFFITYPSKTIPDEIPSHQHAARVMVHMPQYLQNTGYKSPDDGKNGPFQFAFSTKLAYFEHIHADATRAARFNTCMQGNKGKRRQWFEWFPDMDDLVERYTSSTPKSESERVFLVDLGGGNGHHLQRLLDKFPMLKGDLILQDVPVTISSLSSCSSFSEKGKEGGGIHPMVHDIFSPQPIKGAYLYYTHFVLHDFNDEKCRTLLRQTAKAMTPGYSRLLLNETVLPERDCPAEFAALDLTMLAVLSGIERTRGHWVRLVEEVGLRVLEVRVSPDEGDREGVVVAEVPIPVQAPV